MAAASNTVPIADDSSRQGSMLPLPWVLRVSFHRIRRLMKRCSGLPHNATEDIVHKGMVIPKDTQLLANIWLEPAFLL